MRQRGRPRSLRPQSSSIRQATSHPKSIHKHRSSPFRHKSRKRQYTSPGSPRSQRCIQPLTRNCKLSRSLPKYTLNRLCRCSSKLSFSNSANPTAFQVQPLRPSRRGIQVKVRLVGCRRISQVWGLRRGVKDRSSTSSMLLRHQPFGRKHQRQASEQTKHQTRSP